MIDSSSRVDAEIAYGIRKDYVNLMRDGMKSDKNRWVDYKSGNSYVIPYVLEGSLSELYYI